MPACPGASWSSTTRGSKSPKLISASDGSVTAPARSCLTPGGLPLKLLEETNRRRSHVPYRVAADRHSRRAGSARRRWHTVTPGQGTQLLTTATPEDEPPGFFVAGRQAARGSTP